MRSGGGVDAGGGMHRDGGADAGGMHSGGGTDAGGMHSDGGADAGGMRTAVAARTRGDAHSGGGADAPERCLPRPAVPVIRRGPPCPSSAAARRPPPGLRKRKKPRAGRGTFFQMLRGRGRIRAVRGGRSFSDVARALMRRLRARPAA